MVANEKISPWGTEAKFLKIESRNLSQSKKKKKKKKKWPVLIFFRVEPHTDSTKQNIRRAAIFVN